MNKRVAAVMACLLGMAVGAGAGPAADLAPPVREVRVAVAASMTHVMTNLVRRFEQKEPGIRITAVYGASGSFYAQLANGAPYDLFLSADTEYPARLVEERLGVRDSLFVYARGRLVLWAGADVLPEVKPLELANLRDVRIRKVAVANPRLAPYGRAAVDAMRKGGVYEDVKGKLVYGENVAQAASFAQAGAAEMALLPASLALAPAMAARGRCTDVKVAGVAPVEQAAVLLAAAAQTEAARAFLAFLRSPEGVRVLESAGFCGPDAR